MNNTRRGRGHWALRLAKPLITILADAFFFL